MHAMKVSIVGYEFMQSMKFFIFHFLHTYLKLFLHVLDNFQIEKIQMRIPKQYFLIDFPNVDYSWNCLHVK
jgi:hypothetical protein